MALLGTPVTSIDDIFGKPKKSKSIKRSSSSSFSSISPQPTVPLASESTRRTSHSFKKNFSIEESVSNLNTISSSNSQSLPALSRLSKGLSDRKQPRETPRYLMPRQPPKTDCDVISRARSLVLAADKIQQQLLNPDSDPVYKRNEHRLKTKARARENQDAAERRAMHSLAAKEMRADRAAHDIQFEKQLNKNITTYRNDIKHASVAVQRTLVSDPILLRHQKEAKERQRRQKSGVSSGAVHSQDNSKVDSLSSFVHSQSSRVKIKNTHQSSSSSSSGNIGGQEGVEPMFATGAHSKEGDLAIRRAKELTAMALSQL